MQPILSIADQFAAALSAERADASHSPAGSFRNAKWPLFSIPPLTIYLQGLRPIDWTLEGRALALSAIQAATATKRGPGRGQPFTTTQLELALYIAQDKSRLYSDIDWHKEAVAALVDSGLPIHKERVASLSTVLDTIQRYRLALLEHLGLESTTPAAELMQAVAKAMAPTSTISKPLTTLELAQALDDL